MTAVGVIGRNAIEWTKVVTQIGRDNSDTVCIICLNEAQAPTRVNVLVVLESSPLLPYAALLLENEDYLLVNADDKRIFARLPRNKAGLITFGFNGKSCITASSVTDDTVQVCIQRGFYTLHGHKRDPQEFATPYPFGASTSAVLAAAAACTVCDLL